MDSLIEQYLKSSDTAELKDGFRMMYFYGEMWIVCEKLIVGGKYQRVDSFPYHDLKSALTCLRAS